MAWVQEGSPRDCGDFCYFISVCGRYPLHPCGRFFSFQKAVTPLLPYIWWAFGGIHESVSRLWYTMSWCYLKCLLLSLPFLHPEPPLFYYRQSLTSTLCFSFWDLPIGMTIQPITRDAGDRGPLQIYAAGGDAGHCTEPFVHGQFCIRVFCQKCRNIIADANFQGDKSTAFITKMRKQGFYFSTHSWVYSLVQWAGRGKRCLFFFFFRAGASGICVSTADENIPVGVDSVACSVDTGTIISVCSDKDGGEKVLRFHHNDGVFLSFWCFSINTSAGWFYSLIISQSIN